jgi:hypothetical protein
MYKMRQNSTFYLEKSYIKSESDNDEESKIDFYQNREELNVEDFEE